MMNIIILSWSCYVICLFLFMCEFSVAPGGLDQVHEVDSTAVLYPRGHNLVISPFALHSAPHGYVFLLFRRGRRFAI
jgi:hypothetical protein